MKSLNKKIFIIMLCFIIGLMSVFSVNAAEVNSVPANIGDTITYELHVNACPNPIQALDVVIYYDSNSLEYVPYSLELQNISGFMTNTNITGEIRFNAMDFVGFFFDEDKLLSQAQFTVKDTSAQNLNLTYEIKAFIDSNTTDLGNTYVYDITSVNGNTGNMVHEDSSRSEFTTDSDIIDTDTSEYDVSEIMTDSEETTADETDFDMALSFETDTDTQTDSQISFQADNITDNEYTGVMTPEPSSSELTSTVSQPRVQDNPDKKLYLIVGAAALAVVILIGLVFTAAAKRSGDGAHFS